MDPIADPFLTIGQDGSIPDNLLLTADDHLGSLDLDFAPLNSPTKMENEIFPPMPENPGKTWFFSSCHLRSRSFSRI